MAGMTGKFDGPIPGENYTSDTKNYPWHRPPEFTDLDEAIDYIGKRLTKQESAVGFLSMAEAGISISDLTQMFLMSGVGAGKWTLDYALLLAGPTAHIIRTIVKAYGLKVNMGFKMEGLEGIPTTKTFFEATRDINVAKAAAAGRKAFDEIDDIQEHTAKAFKDGTFKSKSKGKSFMNAENPREQEQMLGMGNEMTEEGIF